MRHPVSTPQRASAKGIPVTGPAPLEQHTWFGTAPLPSGLHPAAKRDFVILPVAAEATAFARLWSGFMAARILLALVILGVQLGLLYSGARAVPVWLLALCLCYLALTVLVRVLARPRGPGRSFDSQWLYTAGVDLAFFLALHLQPESSVSYTPLLALPVLMSAILGSRALAHVSKNFDASTNAQRLLDLIKAEADLARHQSRQG